MQQLVTADYVAQLEFLSGQTWHQRRCPHAGTVRRGRGIGSKTANPRPDPICDVHSLLRPVICMSCQGTSPPGELSGRSREVPYVPQKKYVSTHICKNRPTWQDPNTCQGRTFPKLHQHYQLNQGPRFFAAVQIIMSKTENEILTSLQRRLPKIRLWTSFAFALLLSNLLALPVASSAIHKPPDCPTQPWDIEAPACFFLLLLSAWSVPAPWSWSSYMCSSMLCIPGRFGSTRDRLFFAAFLILLDVTICVKMVGLSALSDASLPPQISCSLATDAAMEKVTTPYFRRWTADIIIQSLILIFSVT